VDAVVEDMKQVTHRAAPVRAADRITQRAAARRS
jgi:hypothetical protein